MKALAAGLALILLASPAFAAEADENLLYRWGECAAVGSLFEVAIDEGSSDPRIASASDAFHNFEPRMEAYTNGLAAALGEARANVVQARLLADYDGDLARWAEAEDREGFLLATWGETMDRCLKEATALPIPGRPVT